MRIAYNNIIDDLTSTSISALTEETGYEITNVQDQRLTTKWKTSSATEQNVIFTLDTFPTYPDNVSGQTYFQHFDTATVDSWIASLTATNETVFATTSNLIIKATTDTVYSYLQAYRAQAWTTAQTLIIKTEYDADISSIQYYNGTSFTSMTLVNDNDVNYFAEASMVHGSTYSVLTIRYNYASTAIAATKTIPIDYIYLGNGKYDFALEDLSGNGMDGTCYDVVPGQEGLHFNGINSYVSLDITKFNHTGAFSFSCKIEGKVRSARQDIFVRGAVSPNSGIFLFLTANNRPNIRISVDGTATADLTADAGTECTTDCKLTFAYKPSAYMRIYKDGVLIKETTSSVPGLAYYSASQVMTLGVMAGQPVWYSGFLDDITLYKRELTDAEIAHIAAGESFITENDGLVGKWNANDGLGVNTSAILGHNINTGTQVKIQASDNNYWTDLPVDETLTVNPETILKFLDDTYYYKYWRFYFSGQGDLEIGRLWLGEYLTIDPSSLLDFKVTKKRSDTVIHGKNRQKWASEGVGWRRIEMNFPPTEETMIRKLTNFYSDVRNHSSFIFMNFDSIREYALVEPIYCSIDGSLGFTHDNRMKFSWSLNIEEEL